MFVCFRYFDALICLLTCECRLYCLRRVFDMGHINDIPDFTDFCLFCVCFRCGSPLSGNPSLTQARYRTHLEGCLEALHSYDLYRNADIVLAAAELRTALRQIGKITGKITSEEILDVVFRDFCIGK